MSATFVVVLLCAFEQLCNVFLFSTTQVQNYVMTVQAQDAGKPMLSSTVTVYINVIDENDNAPVFDTNSYNVDVYENATVNTAVAAAMATDRDSGKQTREYWQSAKQRCCCCRRLLGRHDDVNGNGGNACLFSPYNNLSIGRLSF